jgi:hypothetical protein
MDTHRGPRGILFATLCTTLGTNMKKPGQASYSNSPEYQSWQDDATLCALLPSAPITTLFCLLERCMCRSWSYNASQWPLCPRLQCTSHSARCDMQKEINSFEKVVAIMSVICWKLDFSGPL